MKTARIETNVGIFENRRLVHDILTPPRLLSPQNTTPTSLNPPPHRLCPNFSPHQPPPPNAQHRNHNKEIKHQRPTEDNRMILPRIFNIDVNLRNRNSPGKNPVEVRAEGLVEVPARGGCEENGGELVGEGVEDVAPVYGLCGKRLRVNRGRERNGGID